MDVEAFLKAHLFIIEKRLISCHIADAVLLGRHNLTRVRQMYGRNLARQLDGSSILPDSGGFGFNFLLDPITNQLLLF